MINAQMKQYNYYLYNQINNYGQKTLSDEVKGSVKMAINILNQNTENSILYNNCSYVGLSLDKTINDNYVIIYNGEKLKVKYTNPIGRYNQVFMVVIK